MKSMSALLARLHQKRLLASYSQRFSGKIPFRSGKRWRVYQIAIQRLPTASGRRQMESTILHNPRKVHGICTVHCVGRATS